MEIKINKEIRQHKETIFFGLTVRQLLCSSAAVGAAVGIYLSLHELLGDEITSWLCILMAVPLGVAGFFQYNGLTFELFLWAVIKTCVLCAGPRKWRSENYMYELHTGKEEQHD